jgi:hypothetical protein
MPAVLPDDELHGRTGSARERRATPSVRRTRLAVWSGYSRGRSASIWLLIDQPRDLLLIRVQDRTTHSTSKVLSIATPPNRDKNRFLTVAAVKHHSMQVAAAILGIAYRFIRSWRVASRGCALIAGPVTACPIIARYEVLPALRAKTLWHRRSFGDLCKPGWCSPTRDTVEATVRHK